ncbi:formimidoylglutamate deiminase [Paracidovorax konjaci]|uniref:Formimidoylglutamate deiminase n=1 Tax=Paracidovorax konjaci TaxID=32040 RepID=A0A1I1T807_9BURK|nr:formimidoylglutamate deiminase [Paracidovorax konjaci]SFD54722.1 formimidoylglutamate deiminase [Paracidovorax konjaci]
MTEHIHPPEGHGGALFAAHALLPAGWAEGVLLRWDDEGRLTDVQPGSGPAPGMPHAPGPVLPGMPNLHSHAFQRAFTGLTEYRAASDDSFWSWRDLMYRFAARMSPEALEAIATWLYVEMLEAGYAGVCEFHYLHHAEDGRPYADDAEMSLALLRAARRAGIAITLLPVLYQTGGFGGQPAREAQRRFLHATDAMLLFLERLKKETRRHGGILGLAPHSLRAVPPESLRAALAGLDAIAPGAPVHIHIAEQTQEVDDCVAWSGQRPVEWLLDHAPVDARWCLVHATHLTAAEAEGAARTGAVAGLCPTTEANLGDGLFDLPRWRAAGGRWGVGSDSHACVNAAEELLLLEYGQRLALRRRNVLATEDHAQVATALLLQAVQGGAQASGRLPSAGAQAGLVPGQPADFVALDADHIALRGLPAASQLAGHVFGSHRTSAVHGVWSAGVQRVTAGRHALHGESAAAFAAVRSRILHA